MSTENPADNGLVDYDEEEMINDTPLPKEEEADSRKCGLFLVNSWS